MAKDTDQLTEMRKQYVRARDASVELYDMAREDIRFVVVPGNQWDAKLKARRGERPCYEFPKLSGHTRQVINEMKQARPQGKVRGVEDGDRALAELMQGLCRNIESVSNAEQAYDIGFEPAVQGGMGAWRIVTDYFNQDDFDQDIRIKPIRNPFSVKFDPAAVEIDRRDGNFCFVEELIPTEEFERKYPDAKLQDFDDDHDCRDWREAGQVRIAEYWYKRPMQRELWALSDGAVVYADEVVVGEQGLIDGGIQIVKRRMVDTHKVFMRLTNGHEFLTEEHEFPSKYIPIIPCWGNIQNVDGADYWQGMVRPSKDQQRLHNVHRTATVEAVAKAPKAPFIVKMKWIQKYLPYWNTANAEDRPFLPVDDEAPDDYAPQRTRQAEVPDALIQLAGMDNDDMKAATGQYDASLGARSNETSGIAIGQRKQQGATATYNYIDNLTYAIRYTYEILVDMIPRVYDTPRVVRVLGEDGGEEWKQLYQQVQDPRTGQMVTLNDISKGKYDVAVTVGPSFATQRMEAVANYADMAGQIGNAFPPLAAILAYQVVKNTDLPGSEEVDKAMRKLLVAQGLLEPEEGEEPPPPPQQPPPDPRMEAQVKKLLADAEKSAASAAKTQAEAQAVAPQAQADIEKTIAEAVALQIQSLLQGGQLAAMVQRSMQVPTMPQLPPQAIQSSPGAVDPAQLMPPDPGQPFPQPQQPSQGGFSLPDDQGQMQ